MEIPGVGPVDGCECGRACTPWSTKLMNETWTYAYRCQCGIVWKKVVK